jgi:hypothetical protein
MRGAIDLFGLPSALLTMEQVMHGLGATVAVLTQHRVYLRDYLWQMQFDSRELQLSCESWPWRMVVELEIEGQVQRVQDAYARAFKRILRWSSQHPDLHSFTNQEQGRVTALGLRRFLMKAEDAAGADSDRGILRDFSIFVSVLFRLGPRVFSLDLSKGRVGFRSRRRYIAVSRPLLSDGVDGRSLETGFPLAATPFEKYADLKASEFKKVAADLERVRSACIEDLEQGSQARKSLLALGACEPSSEILKEVCILNVKKSSLRRDLLRDGAQPSVILNVVAYQIASKELYKKGSAAYQVPMLKDVTKLLFGSAKPFTSGKIFEMGYRASVEEVFAATLLLQTYCGWNFSTLMALRADGVRVAGGLVELTGGFKSKTDDDAPSFALDTSTPGVKQAVELLHWNRKSLILHGHLHASFEGLFVTAKSCHLGGFHPIAALESLISRKSLPRFSLDQVRTQVLYQAGIDRGGIERANRMAGHASFGTTGAYLRQLSADRLHSASNLEFQRRLESELVYAVKPSQRKLLKGLTAIGDGTSCVDPHNPPADRSSGTDDCLGQLCHSAGGCPNRRVVIDEGRMKEVLRTRHHYQQRLHAMQESNPEYFKKFSLPVITMNEALHSVLERGPHAGAYAKLERELKAIHHAAI